MWGPPRRGSEQWAPPELCPLVAIVGNFTDDSKFSYARSRLVRANVAILIDVALADLNSIGIIPEIEDGFRTTQEQADRRKK